MAISQKNIDPPTRGEERIGVGKSESRDPGADSRPRAGQPATNGRGGNKVLGGASLPQTIPRRNVGGGEGAGRKGDEKKGTTRRHGKTYCGGPRKAIAR